MEQENKRKLSVQLPQSQKQWGRYSTAGLIDTPKRVAKMYAEVFSGLTEPEFDDYKLFDSLNEGEMVLVKDIAFIQCVNTIYCHFMEKYMSLICQKVAKYWD